MNLFTSKFLYESKYYIWWNILPLLGAWRDAVFASVLVMSSLKKPFSLTLSKRYFPDEMMNCIRIEIAIFILIWKIILDHKSRFFIVSSTVKYKVQKLYEKQLLNFLEEMLLDVASINLHFISFHKSLKIYWYVLHEIHITLLYFLHEVDEWMISLTLNILI